MFSQVYFFHPIAAILFLAAISGISLICCPFCPLIFCIETVIYSAMAFLQMTQIYMKMVCFVLEQRETDILFSSFRCGLPQSHGAPQFNVYTSFLQSYWFGFTHRSRDCLSSAFVLIFFSCRKQTRILSSFNQILVQWKMWHVAQQSAFSLFSG